MARSYNYLGTTYQKDDEIEIALEYYFKALKIFENIGNKTGIASASVNIGKLYYKQKKYAIAREYALSSFKTSKELGYIEALSNATKLLYEIYKAENNSDKALEMHESYTFYSDSLVRSNNRTESLRKEFQYDYDKKIANDSIKAVEEKKVIAAQFKQEKTQRYALFGGMVMIGLFALFMFNRFKISQRQKKLIEIKEKETQKQKQLVDEKQNEILASIRYAKRIQESILPSERYIDRNLKELKKE